MGGLGLEPHHECQRGLIHDSRIQCLNGVKGSRFRACHWLRDSGA